MTAQHPTFAHMTDDDILTLVLNRAPNIPASVAQQLADHLRFQSERIMWLEHEATELRARVFGEVQVFGGSTVTDETVGLSDQMMALELNFDNDTAFGTQLMARFDDLIEARVAAGYDRNDMVKLTLEELTALSAKPVKPTIAQRVWYWWNTP